MNDLIVAGGSGALVLKFATAFGGANINKKLGTFSIDPVNEVNRRLIVYKAGVYSGLSSTGLGFIRQ